MTDEFDDALALANGPAGAAPAAARGAGRRGVARPRHAPAEGAAHVGPAWESARATAFRSVRPLPPRRLPLDLALGHTLAAPLTALTDLPAFDTSAMDGWAVAGPGPWRLTAGEPGLLAGAPAAGRLTDGEAVPIATGARVPEGATAVLRSERGTAADRRLRGPSPQPGADIRPRGQECRSGTELLPARTTLTPAALGLAAAAGYDQLAVRPKPRAEVLVLGDELLFRGLPHDGRIRDALGPMTGPWLAALGAQVMVTRRLGDDAEALHEAMSTSRADLIVTTGSTAAGPMDHLRAVLARLGAHLLISGVAVRPGHPMLLAELPGGTPLVGLPGNPLAAVSGLLTLAEPLLRALADRPAAAERHGRLTDEVRGHPEDTRLVPVELPEPDAARPLTYAGPAMLRGIAAAAALAVIPAGGARAQDRVRLLDLPAA
ncbi:molybdopterin molybdotransferase MoeA [Streptomyces johnsoniae]|uniref:Molybdopterin molybdenumtransferase n=1 Tax=Streptomyces johnsoniae TaxID=3075532 RepID=A0ABU2SHN0_9ACTN|nr:molybdopterin molybdotransferase MoeA [Streptomyces sp. DSM 41886]MDT0447389.1 molybdopterin molybdotransferase MoeA [Streptomyces sp. DSM 41886]